MRERKNCTLESANSSGTKHRVHLDCSSGKERFCKNAKASVIELVTCRYFRYNKIRRIKCVQVAWYRFKIYKFSEYALGKLSNQIQHEKKVGKDFENFAISTSNSATFPKREARLNSPFWLHTWLLAIFACWVGTNAGLPNICQSACTLRINGQFFFSCCSSPLLLTSPSLHWLETKFSFLTLWAFPSKSRHQLLQEATVHVHFTLSGQWWFCERILFAIVSVNQLIG